MPAEQRQLLVEAVAAELAGLSLGAEDRIVYAERIADAVIRAAGLGLTLTQQVADNAARIGQPVPHVLCPTCNGHRLVPLSAHLLATWQALSDKPQTAAEVGRAAGASTQATTHRLGNLAGLGLVRMVGTRPPDPPRCYKAAAEWVREVSDGR